MTTSTTQLLTYFSASSVTSFSDWLRFCAGVANAGGQPRPSSSRCSPSPSRFVSRGLGFSYMYVQYMYNIRGQMRNILITPPLSTDTVASLILLTLRIPFPCMFIFYPHPICMPFAICRLVAGSLACHHPKAPRFPEKSAPAHKEIPPLPRA
ncbi:hypothetical protein I7I50_00290 [Histoplasma capsulatum G186AR]|uniref:Uncharacterized protein n=1 Tax=Ajellomyces capsulatus TaxID=5037 RepID=A0A8H7YFG8_AJECA|nr:hypothetical protein I7I52_07558 [Histoplasma capsulatum]QSS72440.1 hypothetical protein I7I50_00290 [Histoplasma capsulatum G186AR]